MITRFGTHTPLAQGPIIMMQTAMGAVIYYPERIPASVPGSGTLTDQGTGMTQTPHYLLYLTGGSKAGLAIAYFDYQSAVVQLNGYTASQHPIRRIVDWARGL